MQKETLKSLKTLRGELETRVIHLEKEKTELKEELTHAYSWNKRITADTRNIISDQHVELQGLQTANSILGITIAELQLELRREKLRDSQTYNHNSTNFVASPDNFKSSNSNIR